MKNWGAAARVTRAATLLVLLASSAVARASETATSDDPSRDVAVRAAREKLDARLLSASVSDDLATVWVEFGDKGEDGAEGRAAQLARAEASLAPRALRRRLRTRVVPLVDERDVPVAPRYLAALRERGLAPIAVSRWFNRAAVRVPGRRLLEIASLGFVRRLAPVERAVRIREIESPEAATSERIARHASPEGSRSTSAFDYGLTFDQLDQLRIPAVHDCGYTGRGVLVAVFDEGFNQHDRHEALRDHPIAPGHRRDFVAGDTVVTDSTSAFSRHGTWVLGCLAANRFGTYVGAAFGADLALARTEDGIREVPAEMLYWSMAAEWADSLGADIISSSLGYFRFPDAPSASYTYEDMDGHTTEVTRAAQIAASKGILVVNSVGNEGNTPWRHLIAPADMNGDSMLAVGAVDLFGDTASFSSAGPSADGRIKPDVVARGVRNPIVSTTGNPTGYSENSGTSFSAPLVAGLMACLIEARPDRTPPELIAAVRSTASRASSPDQKMGFGIPDALAALHEAIAPGTPPTAFFPLRKPFFRVRFAGVHPYRGGSVPVSFEVAEAQEEPVDARLRVLDLQGRELRTVWTGRLCFGQPQSAVWDGTRDDGSRAGPGIFWLSLEGGGHVGGVRIVALR